MLFFSLFMPSSTIGRARCGGHASAEWRGDCRRRAALAAAGASYSAARRAGRVSRHRGAPEDFVAFAASRAQGRDLRASRTEMELALGRADDRHRPRADAPIVNGYLGINLPWFSYAANVLHRFPDPESLWLLRKWKVDTVVSWEVMSTAKDLIRCRKSASSRTWRIFEVPAGRRSVAPVRRDADARRMERIDTPGRGAIGEPRSRLA